MAELSELNWSISKRPQTLDEVYGMETIAKEVKNIKMSGKQFPNGIWLNGRFGCGKTTVAKIIAKTIQCQNPTPDGNPCNECVSCKTIINENFGRNTIMFNGGTDGRIDNVRELIKTVSIPSMFGSTTVVIVEEAQEISKDAMQAFLKEVEKPNGAVKYIFTCMEEDPKKLESCKAIISRSRRYDVPTPSVKDLMLYVKHIGDEENIWVEAGLDTTEKIATFCRQIADNSANSFRQAIQNLQKCVEAKIYDPDKLEEIFGFTKAEDMYNIVLDILNGNASEFVMNAFLTGKIVTREGHFKNANEIVVAANTWRAFSIGMDKSDAYKLRMNLSYNLSGGLDDEDFKKLQTVAAHNNLDILIEGFTKMYNLPLGFKDFFSCTNLLCSIVRSCKLGKSEMKATSNLTRMTTDTVNVAKPAVQQVNGVLAEANTSFDNMAPVATNPSPRPVAQRPVATNPTPSTGGRIIRR